MCKISDRLAQEFVRTRHLFLAIIHKYKYSTDVNLFFNDRFDVDYFKQSILY